jgi:hypothetical protein
MSPPCVLFSSTSRVLETQTLAPSLRLVFVWGIRRQCGSEASGKTHRTLGKSTRTGPGRPDVATSNAWFRYRGRSRMCGTVTFHLVHEREIPTMSASWKASDPTSAVGTCSNDARHHSAIVADTCTVRGCNSAGMNLPPFQLSPRLSEATVPTWHETGACDVQSRHMMVTHLPGQDH